MKNLWIIANWKSHKNIQEALEWIDTVGPKIERREDLKVVVCPPFTDVEEVKKQVLVGNYPVMVGVQDLSPFDQGAYTGEEAAAILKDLVELAILGHSERRQHFGETDQLIAQKIREASKYQIIPLVCVQNDQTPVSEECPLVAYEPIFAIGTGHPDTPQNAATVAGVLKNKYGQDLEVLYGGSISPENCQAFLKQENLSGFLIGTASLDPQEFLQIIQLSLEIRKG